MIIKMLKSKIHQATITQTDINYEGSITIDPLLLLRSGIREYEAVDVYNITNGQRFSTYTIIGRMDSGDICVNGAAARLVQKGDVIIIAAYCFIEDVYNKLYTPKIVLLDKNNKIKETIHE